MNPIQLEITIARPQEEVFAYLADIANHPEFMDHFLVDWRLLRVDSVGKGAGARYRVDRRGRRFDWADMTFAEVEPPRKIVGYGRGGKYNRTKTYVEWALEQAGPSITRVHFVIDTEPKLLSDRLNEIGLHGWMRRNCTRALKRMRAILEENQERGQRASVAGL